MRELLEQALDAYVHTLPPAAQVNIRESMQRGESHTADAVEYGWNAALEEALNCYSPDDTATDWVDKIKALLCGPMC